MMWRHGRLDYSWNVLKNPVIPTDALVECHKSVVRFVGFMTDCEDRDALETRLGGRQEKRDLANLSSFQPALDTVS